MNEAIRAGVSAFALAEAEDLIHESADFDMPRLSVYFNKNVARVIGGGRPVTRSKAKRIKTAARILLAAALLAALALSAYAIERKSRSYAWIYRDKEKCIDFSIDLGSDKKPLETGIEVGYIPEGFILTERRTAPGNNSLSFANGDKMLYVDKVSISHNVGVDVEGGYAEIIERNGISYTHVSCKGFETLVWNDGINIYSVGGRVDLNDLFRIADGVK